MESRFVSPGTAFGTDTDTVVVASVGCEARDGEIDLGPGTPFPEP